MGSPESLINQGISALGGLDSISALNNVRYAGETILRTKGLMLSISVEGLDQAVVAAGRQNVTFSYDQPHVKQRIHKVAQLGAAFTFARPKLEPMDFSYVVEGGDDGFAAHIGGSSIVFAPALPDGYLDGLLASYLITEANKWDPFLLRTILINEKATYCAGKVGAGIELPGVHDETTGLTILFDPETDLPHIIRSYEDHPFFGPSTHDLLVYNYVEIDGVKFPRRFKTVYNNKHVIADYAADQVLTNLELDEGFFSRLGNGTIPGGSVPTRDPEYSFAEIGDFSANFVWSGPYIGTFEALDASAVQPFQDVPGLWILNMDLRQAVVELEDGSVIVLDAPPHQSKLVIEWAQRRLGKNVTHVWPSHHHHDHAFGVADYAAIGAKIIAPEQGARYYSRLTLTEGQIITYSRGDALVLRDSQTQLALVDMEATIHAEDHGYAFISPARPTANSSTALFDADHANLAPIDAGDHGLLQELVDALARDRVTLTTHFFPVHGLDGNLAEFIIPSGTKYPTYSPLDFRFNKPSY
ncbi:Metallo-beta-lactamase [Fusarium oxysporum f. sp. vasinfectum]|nr:Metallo-beta-lactamase [Fusarium oxysporum f. sp. vasinfectum]